jgi:hypothetical protein
MNASTPQPVRVSPPLRCVSLLWRPAELALRFSDGGTRVAELFERRHPSGRWRAVLRLRDLETGTLVERQQRGVLGALCEQLAGGAEERWAEVDELREEERQAMIAQIREDDGELTVQVLPREDTKTAKRRRAKPVRR